MVGSSAGTWTAAFITGFTQALSGISSTRSQIHISLLEDLIQDPKSLMKDMFQVSSAWMIAFTPDLSHKHNASGVIRNPTVAGSCGRIRIACG